MNCSSVFNNKCSKIFRLSLPLTLSLRYSTRTSLCHKNTGFIPEIFMLEILLKIKFYRGTTYLHDEVQRVFRP